ncbi:MAG: HAMP domain-containing sensor histidine kinase [Calditrichia bacterium]
MSKINNAVIISDSAEFINHFSTLMEGYDYQIKNSLSFENFISMTMPPRASCYITDNRQGNFPFDKFNTSFSEGSSQFFVLNIGKDATKSIKIPFLIFTLNNSQENINLPTFLDNAQRVLRRDQAQIELASMLLHDVRSPLNSLIGYMELLLNNTFGMLNEGQKNMLEKAMELGDATLDMMEDLNEVFRGEQSTLIIEGQPFSFSEILESVLVNIWIKADHKNIKIRKEVDPALKKIFGDDYQVQRVLTNLLNNAIKYSPENSEIRISAKQNDHQFVQISVADNGQGVKENQLNNLFDKFYRVRNGNKWQKGHGLGLYISKIIVKAHKGKIWAENNKMGGLSVHFTLPVANDKN